MAIRTGPTLYTSNILGPPAPPTKAAFLWEYIMPSIKKGVGSFTTDHIVAVLRALPDTDGTYARFSQRYDSIMEEHCSPDANRSRELDRAFDILERTCECGTEKMLAPDGSLADRCRECQERDRRGLQYRTARTTGDPSPPQDQAA